MYRVWHLTDKEKNKYIISSWDGDTYSYAVYDNEAEYKADKERMEMIEADYRKKMDDYPLAEERTVDLINKVF